MSDEIKAGDWVTIAPHAHHLKGRFNLLSKVLRIEAGGWVVLEGFDDPMYMYTTVNYRVVKRKREMWENE